VETSLERGQSVEGYAQSVLCLQEVRNLQRKKNNNKRYGLNKERELKKIFQQMPGVDEVTRARGSFGGFDIQVFAKNKCQLISVKSTRQKYWSPNTEIKKLEKIKVPNYCQKVLWIYRTPRKDTEKKGWEAIPIK